jgi:hypothetical protein
MTQLLVDQLEELIVTLIEEIRERPAVAAALLAAIVGAVVGSMLASGGRRQPSAPRAVVRSTRKMGDAGDLASLAMRLLQNPIVRGVLFAAVQRQLKRRFSM